MEELTREDQAILMALETASTSGNPATGGLPALDLVSQAMVREYTEVFGLLAYHLEPQKPSLSTKVRILRAVAGQPLAASQPPAAAAPGQPTLVQAEVQDRSFDEMTFRTSLSPLKLSSQEPGPQEPVVQHFAPQQPAPRQQFTPREAAEPAEMTLRHSSVVAHPQAFQPLPAPRTTSYTPWALAAVLGVCLLLGLSYYSGQMGARNVTIALLENKVRAMPIQNAEMNNLRDELSIIRRRFHMVTRVARAAYPMHMMGTDGPEGEVGRLYVCGAHQRWYLNLETLAPPPAGKRYYLWFMTADGPVNGGQVRVNDNATAEMDALTMPAGTRGFAVTLEAADVEPEEPTGTMVLLGEEKISL